MQNYLKFIVVLFFLTILFSQDQTFKLKDGTVITGVVEEETDSSIKVKTKFGTVIINKSELILTQYKVKLNTGETLIGFKGSDDEESITLKTQLGELIIQKSDIIDIQEVGKATVTGEGRSRVTVPSRRSYGLGGILFGGSKMDKDIDFALGEEQLIDLFFDATGYTLELSDLYLSGLSFGFGVTDRFQITTKWGGFFWGDMNLRPKFQLFEKGNWENQQSLSIGVHYHTRWWPNKYEWKDGSIDINDQPLYWGGFFRINEDPRYEVKNSGDLNRIDNQDDNLIEMVEIFSAYTFSKARASLKGRISHTFGGSIQYAMTDNDPTTLYRVYYGLDVDINRKLKMIGEIFYDPYFIELWQRFEYQDIYWNVEDLNGAPVRRPSGAGPIHLDFGFMYALNESFRVGLHFQQPWIGFYWKL